MLIFETMPIWSQPEDEHYRGPAIYRLIVNGRNYCGRTFDIQQRMWTHKSDAKLWKQDLENGDNVQEVHKTIDKNWDDVIIEIIARYPDKDKDNEEDKCFMYEREIEAIKFYDSYRNGLNMSPGGGNIGNQFALGSTRTEAQKQAISQRMTGKKRGFAYNKPKAVHASKGDITWNFTSSLQAAKGLAIEIGENFDQSSISKAARGKYYGKHTYKGITFKYD